MSRGPVPRVRLPGVRRVRAADGTPLPSGFSSGWAGGAPGRLEVGPQVAHAQLKLPTVGALQRVRWPPGVWASLSLSPASSVSPSGAKGLDFHLCPHGAFLRPGRPPPEPQFPASEDPVWEAPLQAQHMATCFHLVASWPVVEAVQVSVNFLDTRVAPPHVHASLASTGPVILELRVCPDPNS